MRLAVVQTKWHGSRHAQIAAIRQLVKQSADLGARLVCLPEFTLSPYFASQRKTALFGQWSEPLHGGDSDQLLAQLSAEHQIFIVGSIFERTPSADLANPSRHHFWDTATLYNPQGRLIGYTRKLHIPSGAGYHEDFYYEGADSYPIHHVNHLPIALPTCYDQWFPEVARIYALNGAKLLFYPTAIGSEPEAPELDTSTAWQLVQRGHAVANGVFVAAANRVGSEDVTFFGRSFICDPMGNLLAEASRTETEVISAELDLDFLDKWRDLFPLLQQRRPDTYQQLSTPHPSTHTQQEQRS